MATQPSTSKPKVYWRPVDDPEQDPDDACWAVKMSVGGGPGIMDVGVGTWAEAYCWAYLTVALDRLDSR